MPRNIVILCDGTSNEIKKNRTNIVRLYGCLKRNDEQLVFYDPGVGTMGAANSWSPTYRKLVEVWGLATGYGLDQNVKEAYSYLVQTYQEDDRIYIFGFSRGAYTARVLAALIHAAGLIRPDQLNLLEYIYRAFSRIKREEERYWGSDRDPLRLFRRMLEPKHPPIRCLGLFDTVGSVLVPHPIFKLPVQKRFAWTDWNTSVEAVRHALAIDERRVSFRPQLWPKGHGYQPVNEDGWIGPELAKQDVREVWFSGVHADIGGGYPERESGLAKIALAWMIDEVRDLGLQIDEDTFETIVLGEPETLLADGTPKYTKPDPLAWHNYSMTMVWALMELVIGWRWVGFSPNQADRGRHGFRLPLTRRTISRDADIHGSVQDRRGTEHDYPQPNLPGAPG